MGQRPGGVVILTTRESWCSGVIGTAAPYSALPAEATKRGLRPVAENGLAWSHVPIDE